MNEIVRLFVIGLTMRRLRTVTIVGGAAGTALLLVSPGGSFAVVDP